MIIAAIAIPNLLSSRMSANDLPRWDLSARTPTAQAFVILHMHEVGYRLDGLVYVRRDPTAEDSFADMREERNWEWRWPR